MKSAAASAPGKIILFGEHAVVHGQPAIAVPLSAVQAFAYAEPAPAGSGLVVQVPEAGRIVRVPDLEGGPLYNALGYPAELAVAALGVSLPDLLITLRSTIPMGAGLGSGAALAAVIARAIGEAYDRPFGDDALNRLVYEAEMRHHGNPSGIDNTVIVFQQPVYFVRGTPVETFDIKKPFTLLVADSGVSTPTHRTVADVAALYQADAARVGAAFRRIGAIVNEARAAIESGLPDALGALMNENHHLLASLTVSSDRLDALCEAALDAGAQGAKLSGGGRGGNIIALTAARQAPDVAEALRRAGAANVIMTTVRARS